MKSFRQELWFNLPARMEFVNITPQVETCVRESGVQEGLCLVNAMHITASVFINDNEAGLLHDYKKWLEELAPFDPSPERYQHNRTGEDNADAHHKRQIMGREVVVAITEGQAGLRTLGANLLRGIRWPAEEAGAGEDHRRMIRRDVGVGTLPLIGCFSFNLYDIALFVDFDFEDFAYLRLALDFIDTVRGLDNFVEFDCWFSFLRGRHDAGWNLCDRDHRLRFGSDRLAAAKDQRDKHNPTQSTSH